MKKLILISCALFSISCQIHAQTSATEVTNNKFISAMETNLATLDTATNPATFIMLANNFERIATAEKTKWEPYYYAAYCYAIMAVSVPDKTKIDMLADKAELYLQQADKLQPGHSEISTLFAMIKSSKILVDPISRWQILSKEVNQHLAEAKLQDQNNPRPYLIEARIKLNTPEGLGGGKEAAKTIIMQSVEKFKNFKPASSLAPHWGQQQAERFLEKLNAAQ